MVIPGLPGGLTIYQGHLFPLKGHLCSCCQKVWPPKCRCSSRYANLVLKNSGKESAAILFAVWLKGFPTFPMVKTAQLPYLDGSPDCGWATNKKPLHELNVHLHSGITAECVVPKAWPEVN